MKRHLRGQDETLVFDVISWSRPAHALINLPIRPFYCVALTQDILLTEKMSDRNELIDLAKLAEQTERYDDMAEVNCVSL